MKSYGLLQSFLGVRKPSLLLNFHQIAEGTRNTFCCINYGGIFFVYDTGLQKWKPMLALTFNGRTN